MQENSLNAYVRISKIKNPVATGELNGKGDPVYTITAVGIALCGSIRDRDTGSYQPEYRDIDLVFSNISSRHSEMLSEGCEILIGGANVVSYDSDIAYPRKMFGMLSNQDSDDATMTQEEIVEFLVDSVTKAHPDLSFVNVSRQIGTLIQRSRRRTVVRVMPGQWSLKASPKQIATAHAVEMEDFSAL